MIEFAIVCPLLLALVFGIVAYGYLFGIYSSIQHVASEAARASVAGMDDAERDRLARNALTATVGSYGFIESSRLTVETETGGASTPTFRVRLSYDVSGTIIYAVPFLPMPQSPLVLTAAVQRGGY